MKKICLFIAIIIFLCSVLSAGIPMEINTQNNSSSVSSNIGYYTTVNISNWSCWVYRNGQSAHSPSGGSGAFYPKGSAGAIYQDGFVWGAKVDTSAEDDDIRVGGQTYIIGTVPGRVITGGNYEDGAFEMADVNDSLTRIFRIRRDYETLTHELLIEEAATINEIDPSSVTESMTQEIIDQYHLDWLEWPADWGAPYYDLDEDGIYTHDIDEPGIADADQVIWYVVNDYNAAQTRSLYGSDPMGIELQTTLWAYDKPGVHLMQSFFKSYKLINTSNRSFVDMYISQWSDPDIGVAGNDFVACDTVRNLGFSYNGKSTDADYDHFSLPPPAVGYDLLQGPMVGSVVEDTAYFNFKKIPGYKNLLMTSFAWFAAGSAITDPDLGEYDGTIAFYNMMRGFKPVDDINNPVPWHLGNNEDRPTTVFPLSGDPVNGTGDIDGEDEYFAPSDRRICISSGPFYMAPGDTQEVIIAVVGGLGTDNISSVSDMYLTSDVVQDHYDKLGGNQPETPEEDLVGIIEVVQLDAPNGSVVDDNLFLSLNYNGDGSQPWHVAAGAPRFFITTRTGQLFDESDKNVIDRFNVCGSSDFEIVFGDSSVAWSFTTNNVLDEKVPFAIYKYDLDESVRRMFISVYDFQVDDQGGTWDQGVGTSLTDSSGYEVIYVYDNSGTGYQVDDEDAYVASNDLSLAPSNTGFASSGNPYVYPQLNNIIIGMYPEGTVGPPANGTVIRLNTPKPVVSSDMLIGELSFDLGNAYPNPFNPQTVIPFTLDKSAQTELKIFDVRGNWVSTLVNSKLDAGNYRIRFNGSQLPSGAYIYRLISGDRIMTGKMMLLK